MIPVIFLADECKVEDQGYDQGDKAEKTHKKAKTR